MIPNTSCKQRSQRLASASAEPGHYEPGQWLGLISGHWVGVEIRNHWRRDAIMGEERSRCRNPQILANLAIIRSALLCALAEQSGGRYQPEIHDSLHSNPGRSWEILNSL